MYKSILADSVYFMFCGKTAGVENRLGCVRKSAFGQERLLLLLQKADIQPLGQQTWLFELTLNLAFLDRLAQSPYIVS